MTALSFALAWLGLAAFVAATCARAIRYARAPVHLRWELYPVPHEAPERVAHGGSRYEEGDWWTKPQRRNIRGELAYMLPEMLLLVALRQHNRKLWYRSYPFHLGLYLVTTAAALLVACALLDVAGAGVTSGSTFRYAMGLTCRVLGATGIVLGTGGALGLLHARLSDPKLRSYSAPADYFNVALFTIVLPVLGAGFLIEPSPALDVAARLLRFDVSQAVHPLLAAGLGLAALTAAYVPLTHMSHFVAKWFTYHNVRWDDRPTGDRVRARMTEYLTYRPTWSAAHMGTDETRSWSDIAASDPTRGGRG